MVVAALLLSASLSAVPLPDTPTSKSDYLVAYAGGRVVVQASEVPLRRLLDDLAGALSFDQLHLDRKIEQRKVTITLDDTPRAAVVKVVSALGGGVAFILWGGDDPRGFRLYVGEPEFVAHAAATAVARDRVQAEALPERLVEDPQPSPVSDEQDDDEAKRTAATLKLLQAHLAPVPRPATGTLALPFPGPDGKPLREAIAPPGTATIGLPFPGPDGKPLVWDRTALPPPATGEALADPKFLQLLEALTGIKRTQP